MNILATVDRHAEDPKKFLPVEKFKLNNVGGVFGNAVTAGYNGTNNASNLTIVIKKAGEKNGGTGKSDD